MIDVISVMQRVKNFGDIDGEHISFEIAPVIMSTCREIYGRLRDKNSDGDPRIVNACVYLSYYRLLLRAVLTGEITESTKAGDITVSQSPSLRLEWAANMRDEALLAAYPLLEDSDFVFEQVKYEGA